MNVLMEMALVGITLYAFEYSFILGIVVGILCTIIGLGIVATNMIKEGKK